MNKKLVFFLLLPLALTLNACKKDEHKEPILENKTMWHDLEFGGAYIDILITDFNNLGFSFGDSLNLSFSNGIKYEDIGYFTGYYVSAGQELVVGYPGYEFVKFCICYGDDLYLTNNFDSSTTVTITMNEKGKYLPIESTLNIKYSDDDTQYSSLEQFANFRSVTTTNIVPSTLYRGASPIDNRRKRAKVVDNLLSSNNINTIIDCADTRETISKIYGAGSESDYFKQLDQEGNMIPLGMGADYKTEEFSQKMKLLVETIISKPAPYYVHCLEGKDRTGYVCMVLEALCGASYTELIDEYFVTYQNYYGLKKDTEQYNLIKEIHIDTMINYVLSFDEGSTNNENKYQSAAYNYLKSTGLTDSQLELCVQKLTTN